MSKVYVGLSRDHSISMQSIARYAARDYNDNIASIKEAAELEGQDTIVSVVKCGVGKVWDPRRYCHVAKVEVESVNSSVSVLKPIAENAYVADGYSTPLFDSIGKLIEMLESVPDAKGDVSFLVFGTTDGIENSSYEWSADRLSKKIKQLQGTDRWTFVFRVPRGYTRNLTSQGIPEGNILEWDQTQKGVEAATQQTKSAMRSYFSGVKSGKRSTDKFYTDLSEVDVSVIKANLVDISKEVKIWPVKTESPIRDFCEAKLKGPMLKGAAFYQLTKTESAVQDYKLLAIKDKDSGAVYSGYAARDMLGLPRNGTIKLAPGDHGQYDIYIQSTSVNRKLPAKTTLLYWPGVGTAYKGA